MKEPRRRYLHFAWFQFRNVGWWLWAVITLAGTAYFFYVLSPAIIEFPATAVTGFLLGAGLVAFWWWFIRRPQIFGRLSRRAGIAAFLWGAGAGTGVFALNGNEALIVIQAHGTSIVTASSWGPAFAAPITEELGKALGIVVVLLVARSRLRTPMDGMMLGAYVGLGFEIAETFLYGFNVTFLNFAESPILSTLLIFFVREVLLVSINHMIFSGLAGVAIFYVWPAQGRRRWLQALPLFALAWGLHALWNSPFLESLWWRLVVALAVPAVFYVVVKRVRIEEQRWFRDTLAPEVARGTMSQQYVDNVARSLWHRRKFRQEIGRTYGYAASEYQRHLDGLLIDLADAVSVADEASAASYRHAVKQMLTPQPDDAQ